MRTFEISGSGLYGVDVLYVAQPAVKALKGTQNTDPNQWPHPFFIHHKTADRRGVAAHTSALLYASVHYC